MVDACLRLNLGNQNYEEELITLKKAQELGVTAVLVAPECNFDKHNTNILNQQLIESFYGLQEEVEDANIKVNLCLGCVAYGDDQLIELIDERKVPTVNNGFYLLVEFDTHITPQKMSEIVARITSRGIIVVVSRPELCHCVKVQPSLIYNLQLQNKCFIMLDSKSITGENGSDVQSLAFELINCNLAHFVSSFSDSTMYNKTFPDAFSMVAQRFGPYCADHLFGINPHRLLANTKIHPPLPKPIIKL